MKTNKDLQTLFHRETGKYSENHYHEYVRWLEENLISKFQESEEISDLFNDLENINE